ncbi:myeloid leukemia factor [Musca domestica]|uniref:Myeloid leukemia factor n=1 Tax=Musca domestica TaxID=7370 RepID=A0A9J7D2G1_MUSDO|nr:myeloid leukemia factor [Musca domestica]
MSLFGSLMGDFDDDIFGNHMNAMNMQMRSMNRLMNSLMPDPFNMLTPFDPGFQQNALMERQNGPAMGGLFGFPAMGPMMMPNMNRLLSADIGNNGASFCSSSVITMSSGPDGRPQIYQATSSTKTGPGGIRETRRTVQDSVNGVKKMAIGHHIGERAHIIEKEQDIRSGQLEERQEFINLDEDEAEDFDREFTTKASGGRMGQRAIGGVPGAAPHQQTLTIEPIDDDDDDEVIETTAAAAHHSHPQHRPSSSSGSHNRRYLPALPAPPPQHQQQHPSSHQNSSSSSSSTATTTDESRKSTDNTLPSSSNKLRQIDSNGRSLSHGTAAAAAATSTSNTTSPYISTTPRRLSSAYRSGSSHVSGVSPRRPLRTPPSSPLATTPTMHNHSTTTSPSVHPHPYNSSAARRSHHHHHNHHNHHHHRSKHGAKHTSSSPAPAAAAAPTNSNNKSSEESNNQN